MRRAFTLLFFLSFSLCGYAQTGAVPGYCNLGGSKAKVAGLTSSNFQQGIIPSCTVTVYLTGTTTLATIYADKLSSPLGNPFTANASGSSNSGAWIFFAATNAGLDVVLSGGISPNAYPAPVAITDVYPSQSFTPVAGITSINAQSGPAETLQSTGGTVTFTYPDATHINLEAAATGGGGIAAGATVVWTGTSALQDDAHVLGAIITASASSCTSGGICTITATNTYTAGQWVMPYGGFASCVSGNGALYYGTGTQTYQVLASGLSSTQFQIQTSCGAGSQGSGSVEDASYFLPFQTMKRSGFSQAGAMYVRNGVDATSIYSGLTGLVCEQSTNYTGMFHAISPAVTGTPGYIIEEGGFNDINGGFQWGASQSVIANCFKSFWQQAHTDGWTIYNATIVGGGWGIFDIVNPDTALMGLNAMIVQSGKSTSNVGSGQYVDGNINFGEFFANEPASSWAFSGHTFSPAGAQNASMIANGAVVALGSGFSHFLCNYLNDCGPLDAANTWTGANTWSGGETHSGTESHTGADTFTHLRINGLSGSTLPLCADGTGGDIGTANCVATVYPAAGIAVSTGTAWGTSKAAPTGAIVGDSDSQTLTNKNLTSPVLGGTPDASGATQFKLPVAAGFATLANGELGYDSTNLNWHGWQNATDNFVAVFPVSTPPTSGHCAEFSLIGSSWKLIDAGGACGVSGGGVTAFSGDGTLINNSASTGSVTATLANAAAHKFWGNNTGSTAAPGYQSIGTADLPAAAVTIDTSTPVTVTTTNPATFHFNENATAATAVTYNLPTAAAGIQKCFTNAYNGSASNTGILTIATSASGQFIIFTDGTLSATGGNVTSGGAASDAACVVGVDTTHWQLYTQRGTWTKH